MNKCIKDFDLCLGRDGRELLKHGLCCKEEIREEQIIAQTVIDAINDCSRDQTSLQRVSSKFSYAAQVINKNDDDERIEVLSVVQRFSILIYEFQDKILHDTTIGDLACSFAKELQRWFVYQFFQTSDHYVLPVQRESILADINTIEIALGVCIIADTNDSLDDLFF